MKVLIKVYTVKPIFSVLGYRFLTLSAMWLFAQKICLR